jgi:DNA-nicking Smr family endonuclease
MAERRQRPALHRSGARPKSRAAGATAAKDALLHAELEARAEDAKLFREAVAGITPLAAPAPLKGARRPAPQARFARADRMAVLQESLDSADADPHTAAGDELVFRRPHVQPGVIRRLRRGEYRVQREIDLHGLTVAQAKQALGEFLNQCLAARVRCVRIIHGKGLRSGHRGPVLKSAVSGALRRSGAVLAFVSARPVDGGTGALYVLLEP